MIDLIFESGKLIFFWFSESKRNKKEIDGQISIFLTEISNLLDDTVKKLSRNEYPHDNCTQMKIITENLVNALEGKMEKDKIDLLKENLELSTKLEMLYNERKNPDTIKKLKECKGMFRALGQITMVK